MDGIGAVPAPPAAGRPLTAGASRTNGVVGCKGLARSGPSRAERRVSRRAWRVSLQRLVIHERPGELLHHRRLFAVGTGTVIVVVDFRIYGGRCCWRWCVGVPCNGTLAETNFCRLSRSMKE